MTITSRAPRLIFLSGAVALTFLLGACSSSTTTGSGGLGGANTGTTPGATTGATTGASAGASPGSTPTAPSTPTTAPAAPTYYFGNGKTYDAWITGVNSDGTLSIVLVHHLTATDAKNYLTSHGQTIPPDGIPDDYINVDTHVHKNVQFSAAAKVTTNEQGAGPAPMTASAFLTWLATNPAKPLAKADQATYPGAATYYGPLFAVTFSKDVMNSANQIFQP